MNTTKIKYKSSGVWKLLETVIDRSTYVSNYQTERPLLSGKVYDTLQATINGKQIDVQTTSWDQLIVSLILSEKHAAQILELKQAKEIEISHVNIETWTADTETMEFVTISDPERIETSAFFKYQIIFRVNKLVVNHFDQSEIAQNSEISISNKDYSGVFVAPDSDFASYATANTITFFSSFIGISKQTDSELESIESEGINEVINAKANSYLKLDFILNANDAYILKRYFPLCNDILIDNDGTIFEQVEKSNVLEEEIGDGFYLITVNLIYNKTNQYPYNL